jgi:hypothetical protein
MSTLESVRKEIFDLTAQLVEIGLSSDQNFPSTKTYPGENGAVTDLCVSGVDEISAALKERPYSEIYAVLRGKRAYNILMVDGAMIQLRYRFRGGVLLKHVLAFYPSPDLLEYQNDPEIYELDLLYADVISKDVVTSPIRFDFDEAAFEEFLHPKSHFTLGQYKNCRIPVSSALTPHRFINFVLRAFYNTPFRAHCTDWRGTAEDFPGTVTVGEKADLHLSFG